MLHLLVFLFTFLTLYYAFRIILFYYGLTRLTPGRNTNLYSVTILIPARNEEENIARCLDSLVTQSYPKDKLEIIVIDDDSWDRTANIVRRYCDQYPFVQLITLGKCPKKVSPKKRALKVGIESAQGEIIFTTDADCTVSPNWVRQMISSFEPDVGVVVGWVMLSPEFEVTLFHKMQSLEFIGLTTAGMGSIGADDPIIANGANLALRRRTFEDVHGYEGNEHILSGDDDLLLQKVDRSSDWKIKSATLSDTFVFTRPAPDVNYFINQRIRWASKSLIYKKKSLVFFLIAVYFFYLLLLIALPFSIRYFTIFPYPIIALLIKMAVDFLLILKGTALVSRRDLRKFFLITELFQIPYIIYVGFASIVEKFDWKGR